MFSAENVIGMIVSAITMFAYLGVLYILGVASYTVLRGQKARWDMLIFVAIILIAALQVVEEYPKLFLESFNRSLENSFPVMDEIEGKLNEWADSKVLATPQTQTVVTDPPTSTPIPQASPWLTTIPSKIQDTPIATSTPAPTMVSSDCSFTVEAGMTMFSIAEQHDTTIQQINEWTTDRDLSANGWKLLVGEVIQVCE